MSDEKKRKSDKPFSNVKVKAAKVNAVDEVERSRQNATNAEFERRRLETERVHSVLVSAKQKLSQNILLTDEEEAIISVMESQENHSYRSDSEDDYDDGSSIQDLGKGSRIDEKTHMFIDVDKLSVKEMTSILQAQKKARRLNPSPPEDPEVNLPKENQRRKGIRDSEKNIR